MITEDQMELVAGYKQFLSFMKMPLTDTFIEILAYKAVATARQLKINCVDDTLNRTNNVNQVKTLLVSLITESKVNAPTLFGMMVYMGRLVDSKPNLMFEDRTPSMIALSCLNLAGKFLHDSSPKNQHWAIYSQTFSLAEVNWMELEMFKYLNYDLTPTTNELLEQFKSFAHLPHTPQINKVVPLASSVAPSPTSGVFPPLPKTPLILKSNTSPQHPIGNHPYAQPVLLSNVQQPYQIPIRNKLSSKPSSSFKINATNTAGSSLYHRRINTKKQLRKAPSQLSLSTTYDQENRDVLTQLKTHSSALELPKMHSGPKSAPLFRKQLDSFHILPSNVPTQMPQLTGGIKELDLNNTTLFTPSTANTLKSPGSSTLQLTAKLNELSLHSALYKKSNDSMYDPSLKLPPILNHLNNESNYRLEPLLSMLHK